jgi:hypothetical protein
MIDLRTPVVALAVALAVSAASPAQARAYQPGHAARAQAGAQAISGGMGMAVHRDEALRACNAQANRYVQYTYGNMQSSVYRACMTAHGEAE